MLEFNDETKWIGITAGDSGPIVFSAEDSEGTDFSPTTGDILRFGVGKKFGGEPLFEIANEYDGTHSDEFWTISIEPEHTQDMKPGNYVWDIELETSSGTQTIIGKTEEISPKFTVWGDVAKAGEA